MVLAIALDNDFLGHGAEKIRHVKNVALSCHFKLDCEQRHVDDA